MPRTRLDRRPSGRRPRSTSDGRPRRRAGLLWRRRRPAMTPSTRRSCPRSRSGCAAAPRPRPRPRLPAPLPIRPGGGGAPQPPAPPVSRWRPGGTEGGCAGARRCSWWGRPSTWSSSAWARAASGRSAAARASCRARWPCWPSPTRRAPAPAAAAPCALGPPAPRSRRLCSLHKLCRLNGPERPPKKRDVTASGNVAGAANAWCSDARPGQRRGQPARRRPWVSRPGTHRAAWPRRRAAVRQEVASVSHANWCAPAGAAAGRSVGPPLAAAACRACTPPAQCCSRGCLRGTPHSSNASIAGSCASTGNYRQP